MSRPSSSRRSATRSASRSTAPIPSWPTSAPRAAHASSSPARTCSTRSGSSASRAAPRRSPRSRGCGPSSRTCGRSSSSSPSVQLELGADVRIVSTHDQILSGQRYLGCRFPAEPAYARAITESARKIGAALLDAGARGRAGIDYVVTRDPDGSWQAFAIEVNLRSGGTTHPLAALELLSGGAYDADTATFTAPCGSPRHYVATDHLESPRLRALGHGGLLRLAALPRLAADGCGVVFHMLSALDELGRVGLTAIGSTAADAQSRFEQAQALLLDAAVA